jgi:hypothetical protein
MSHHIGDTNKMVDETVNFCPHCHSGNDPVLKDTTWSCGVRFNDSTWRTKECYRRNLELANDRIKRLEEAVTKRFSTHICRIVWPCGTKLRRASCEC